VQIVLPVRIEFDGGGNLVGQPAIAESAQISRAVPRPIDQAKEWALETW
jgi:hypothetical protein